MIFASYFCFKLVIAMWVLYTDLSSNARSFVRASKTTLVALMIFLVWMFLKHCTTIFMVLFCVSLISFLMRVLPFVGLMALIFFRMSGYSNILNNLCRRRFGSVDCCSAPHHRRCCLWQLTRWENTGSSLLFIVALDGHTSPNVECIMACTRAFKCFIWFWPIRFSRHLCR